MRYNQLMLVTLKKNEKLSKEDFEKAKEDYKTYIKITADIREEAVVLGGEYHADAEKLLFEMGSKQADIWGGGFNLITKELETNLMVNIRPGENNSPDILDEKIRRKLLELAKKVLIKYV